MIDSFTLALTGSFHPPQKRRLCLFVASSGSECAKSLLQTKLAAAQSLHMLDPLSILAETTIASWPATDSSSEFLPVAYIYATLLSTPRSLFKHALSSESYIRSAPSAHLPPDHQHISNNHQNHTKHPINTLQFPSTNSIHQTLSTTTLLPTQSQFQTSPLPSNIQKCTSLKSSSSQPSAPSLPSAPTRTTTPSIAPETSKSSNATPTNRTSTITSTEHSSPLAVIAVAAAAAAAATQARNRCITSSRARRMLVACFANSSVRAIMMDWCSAGLRRLLMLRG